MEVIPDVPLIKFLKLMRKLILIGLIFLFVSAVILLFSLLYLRSQPLPPSSIDQTTTIYSDTGDVLDTLYGGQNRTVVPLQKISPKLVEATVSIEDKNFYDHHGFDFWRLGKALLVDIGHMAKVQGASTITQQLARNLYLTLDKTWERKFKEAILTVQLEINYTKDELMEMYLNQIYYGHSAYGAQTAAESYFGKNAADLDLAEASMLAGIPKGPGLYSPYINFKQAKARQHTVLNAMVDQNYITQNEADQAFKEKIHLAGLVPSDEKVVAPYFRDYVTELVKNKYHISEEQLIHGGLKIYTTLDPTMQENAEQIVTKYLPKDRPLQAALIAMDPATGEIKAMVGGKDYKESQFNRVLARRQPGSSFKAFLYFAALENGFTPLTQFKSEPTVFTYGKDQYYTPKNFGDSYVHDYINLRTAIARSDNIYAVNTNMMLGPEKLVETAHRLGIEAPLEPLPSLALGTLPVSPMEMAVGFSTIANQGEKITSLAITKIEDKEGNVIVEEKPHQTKVADRVPAFLLTNLMQSVFEEGGTGYRVANKLHRPVAGKTGTTDYDSWLVGFTPQLTVAVWTGYDEGRKMDPIDDARLTAPIWADFIESALKDQPPKLFDIPDGVHAVYIDPTTNKLATANCPTQKLVYFADGTEPTEYCTVHSGGKPEEPTTNKDKPSIWKRIFKWW